MINKSPGRIYRYAAAAAVVWTLIVATSFVWNVYSEHKLTEDLARNSALATFEKDHAFRLWATSHGGVYVEVKEGTKPNPYLSVPDRDIITPSGKRLTLMNPAYMMRQIMEQYAGLYGIIGKITSLKPLRPENAPDEWEENALKSFESGVKEVFEFTVLYDKPYLRFMRPMITQKGCLKCHSHQGYKEGQIRGGIGVYVPMEPYRVIEKRALTAIALSHTSFWLIGIAVMVIVAMRGRERQIERARAEENVRKSEEKLRSITASLGEGVYVLDDRGRLVFMNPEAERLLGWTEKELSGSVVHDIIHDHKSDVNGIPDKECRVLSVLSSGAACRNENDMFIRKDGAVFPVAYTTTPIMEDGKVAGVVTVFSDITLRKAYEEQMKRSMLEKETLLKEIHHRVKNNMQVITSILSLQAKLIRDEAMAEIFRESQARIKSMAMVHERLYRAENLSKIGFAEYVRSLVFDIVRSYAVNSDRVKLKIDIAEGTELNVDTAIPCGLIINELTSNSFKHAFRSGREGTLKISFCKNEDSEYILTVSDDGAGFPKDIDFSDTSSLGLRLVNMLTKQLGGRIEMADVPKGTEFKVRFGAD
ncbi:MAG: DUF3365 domain-containing protein [Nitrospirae bacterium]|nr:MAG: DUF3365 domain-containing protein [Nitrospirota bacterium]